MTSTSPWPGFFVAVCGIDGSGKTTQIGAIVDFLRARRETLSTRQPSDLYRNDPTVRALLNLEVAGPEISRELALFAAFDRARHLRTEVFPVLERGGAVVSDRYVYSTYSYFLARGIDDIDWLKAINCLAPEPDVTIYIDVAPDIAIQRIIRRDGSSRKREEIDVERMSVVRSAFVAQPWGTSDSYHVIDGDRPQDVVTKEIFAILEASGV
jgi:dTMP kinase